MAQVPTGATFYIASAFASSKTATVVTNAAEAVVTCTAHGYSNGDVVEITSGWSGLNKRAFRIKGVTWMPDCAPDVLTAAPPGVSETRNVVAVMPAAST